MVGRLAALVVLAGCRNLLGLGEPVVQAGMDAPRDSPPDVSIDVALGPCGAPDAGTLTEPVTLIKDSGLTKLTLTMISFSGDTRYPTKPAGSTLEYKFHYVIESTACASSCILQIEIGLVPGNRQGCVFDEPVPKTSPVQGTILDTIPVPATPGRYDVRANIGANFSCTNGGANTWWDTEPPESATIARLCVE